MNAPSGVSAADSQKQALYEAARAAIADASVRPRHRPAPARVGRTARAPSLLLGLALFVAGTYILAARPAWLVTPDPPGEPVEVREASFRLTLVREAHRIRQFHAARGRLPETLAETGSGVAGVRLHQLPDGSFTLVATLDGRDLLYRSTDSAATFLGRSLQVVLDRAERTRSR